MRRRLASLFAGMARSLFGGDPPGRPWKLLISDDEPHIVQLLTRHLNSAGYAIVSTTQSRDVLPLVKSEQPDLLILDVQQPPDPLCGCQIAKALRADAATTNLPIILLVAKSAEAYPDLERLGPGRYRWCRDLPLEAARYVFKPFSPADLLCLITQIRQAVAINPSSAGHVPQLRVLIVEDDLHEAQRLQALMETLGHTVRLAATGEEALVIADAEQPHVALVDTGLPGISGLEVLRRLRLKRRTRGAAVILIHPRANDKDVMESFQYNCDASLLRPIKPLELTTFFTRLTAGKEAWDPGGGHSERWDAMWDRERDEIGKGEAPQ